MLKIAPNGQWTLAKSAPEPSTLHDAIGTTHTVEVHPDLDHLYNVKGLIKQSGKPHLQLNDIKRSGVAQSIVHKLPRDARGRVTPEMIDKHIEGLPKHKVQIKIAPYEGEMQQHRDDVPQYVASVGLHPDVKAKMPEHERKLWENIKGRQHDLSGHEDQVGWARLDPYKVEDHTHKILPNDGHWHIDEIQSDMNNPDNIKDMWDNKMHIWGDIQSDMRANPDHPMSQAWNKIVGSAWDEHDAAFKAKPDQHSHELPTYPKLQAAQEAFREIENKEIERRHKEKYGEPPDNKLIESLHNSLSHGHEDPQHMVHSAINALARKQGIKSISLDMPHDQAQQSGLQPKTTPDNDNGPYWDWHEKLSDAINGQKLDDKDRDHLWNTYGDRLATNNLLDINFKSAAKKLGTEGLRDWADLATKDSSSWMGNGAEDSGWEEHSALDPDHQWTSEKTKKALATMTDAEKNALSRFFEKYRDRVEEHTSKKLNLGEKPKYNGRSEEYTPEYDYPVHQRLTYNKRPKKLGFKPKPKMEVLGPHPTDLARDVQYVRLHKKLIELKELLKKV